MIELRWIEGHELAPEYGPNIAKRVKVLQYRTFQLGIDAGGALTPCGSPGWTDWKNVPTVTAEEVEK